MKFFLSTCLMTVILSFLMTSVSSVVSGQVAISLTENAAISIQEQQCYQITLRNVGNSALSLAGQNYRLYYDSENALLAETSLLSLLPSQYTAMKLVEHHHNVDASGFGVLPYASHLGFINLATDLNLDAAKALSLPVGKAIAVAQMCFDVAPDNKLAVTWAQDHLTHTYATAFVELSIMNSIGIPVKAYISDYKVETETRVDAEHPSVFSINYFPNPFSNQLNIDFNQDVKKETIAEVYDVFARKLKTITIPEGSKTLKVDAEALKNGTYIICLSQNGEIVSKFKCIKI